jgi:hypothetical protein
MPFIAVMASFAIFAGGCAAGQTASSGPAVISTTAAVEPVVVTVPTTAGDVASFSTTVAVPSVAELDVVSRIDWGAAAVTGELLPHDVGRITLHHTADSHDESPPDERLRHWQEYHQSVGFADIACHLVIGADGTIFEGRDFGTAGETQTSYDPTGHFLISLDGMFDEFWDGSDDDEEPDGADELSDAQLGALVDVLAWASVEFGIDAGEIAGHRDYAATACPGSVVYALLASGDLTEMVTDRIGEGAIELVFSDS